jgi:rhodanese-related sulfurtransferase
MTQTQANRLLGILMTTMLASISPLLVGCQDTVSDRDIQSLPLAEVRRLSEGQPGRTLLLDTRSPAEFNRGHLPGAMNVPMDGVEADKSKLPPELASPKYVIVYGNNPGDAYAAAVTKRLLRAGQGGARLFAGGLTEWRKAGLRVEGSGAGSP